MESMNSYLAKMPIKMCADLLRETRKAIICKFISENSRKPCLPI